ncbi:hypothetical protein EDC32_101653 [Laceyella sacchari]|nr:hypothetical protein EDC32_101653 [Laceyella sacchari]
MVASLSISLIAVIKFKIDFHAFGNLDAQGVISFRWFFQCLGQEIVTLDFICFERDGVRADRLVRFFCLRAFESEHVFGDGWLPTRRRQKNIFQCRKSCDVDEEDLPSVRLPV